MLDCNIPVDPGTSNPIQLILQTWVKYEHPKFFASFQWVAVYDAKYLTFTLPTLSHLYWCGRLSPPTPQTRIIVTFGNCDCHNSWFQVSDPISCSDFMQPCSCDWRSPWHIKDWLTLVSSQQTRLKLIHLLNGINLLQSRKVKERFFFLCDFSSARIWFSHQGIKCLELWLCIYKAERRSWSTHLDFVVKTKLL